MIPESKLIRSELTLREMALSEDTKLTRKALIRWIALALGLMAPNESRKLLLDVLEALFYFHWARQNPTTAQLLEKMEELTGQKQNPKAVYYHLLNLKNTGFIHRKKGRYFFSEEEGKKLSDILRQIYEEKLRKAFATMEEACVTLENSYR